MIEIASNPKFKRWNSDRDRQGSYSGSNSRWQVNPVIAQTDISRAFTQGNEDCIECEEYC